MLLADLWPKASSASSRLSRAVAGLQDHTGRSTHSIIVAAISIALATAAHCQPTSETHAEIQVERLKAPTIDKAELCEEETLAIAPPKFPPDALRRRTEGWALVSYDLDGSGRAVNIVLVSSSPGGSFETNTIEVLKRSKFVVGATRTGCRTLVTYALR